MTIDTKTRRRKPVCPVPAAAADPETIEADELAEAWLAALLTRGERASGPVAAPARDPRTTLPRPKK